MTKEEIGTILKEKRISCGMTQKEVADRLGRKQPIIGHWETGYSQPDANTLFTLCDIYGTTVDDVFGFQPKKMNISVESFDLLKKIESLDDRGREHVYTVLDWETSRVDALKKAHEEKARQSARIIKLEEFTRPRYFMSYYQRMASGGSGEYLFDDIPTDLIEVPDTPAARKADFVIGVNGQSMEPDYMDGDKVLVKKTEEILTGSIGVFLRGNDCFIKELGRDRLISHNPDKETHPDIPASEDIRCVGLVLGKIED